MGIEPTTYALRVRPWSVGVVRCRPKPLCRKGFRQGRTPANVPELAPLATEVAPREDHLAGIGPGRRAMAAGPDASPARVGVRGDLPAERTCPRRGTRRRRRPERARGYLGDGPGTCPWHYGALTGSASRRRV